MIPKTIHYCWFGHSKMPKLAKKCIKSWKKFLPDYEIKEWNEDNFDVNIIPYTAEAYKARKYAFVSDYARFWILYHYGGLYFDTDVEIVRPLNHIIEYSSFMGCESVSLKGKNCLPAVNPGLGLGCSPYLGIYREILNFYETIHFINKDGSLNLHTVVEYTTNILVKHGLRDTNEIQECGTVRIYPKDYFCPMSSDHQNMKITDNTVSIHHYNASWKPWKDRMQRKYAKLFRSYLRIRRLFARKK